MRVIVIGAGFAGAVAAYRLTHERGASVTVLESGPRPGGMLQTHTSPEGLAYEYGPRIVSVFRGAPEVIPFLERFLELQPRDIYQGTRLRPEYPAVPFPVDRESLLELPCGDAVRAEWSRLNGHPPDETNLKTYLESTVGPTLTSLAFEPFNIKFWGRRLEDIDADWGKLRRLERIPDSGEFRLPSVAPHYYPKGGFNPLFDQLLDGLDVRYDVDVRAINRASQGATVRADDATYDADVVVSTAPIDAMLQHRFGQLEWKGYRVEHEVVESGALGVAPDGVPFAWLYTPWLETDVCRTTDFGTIHHGRDSKAPAILLKEIPDDCVKMYPVGWENERFAKYLDALAHDLTFVPLGRLGFYKYVTMDSTYGMVDRMLDQLDELLAAPQSARRLEILRSIRGDWAN